MGLLVSRVRDVPPFDFEVVFLCGLWWSLQSDEGGLAMSSEETDGLAGLRIEPLLATSDDAVSEPSLTPVQRVLRAMPIELQPSMAARVLPSLAPK